MSTKMKIQISRLGIIATATLMVFSALSTMALAQDLASMRQTAEVVAGMNVMQLMAYIMLASIASNVIVIGFYVKSVATFQKESAVATAMQTAKMGEIAVALHELSENCKRNCSK